MILIDKTHKTAHNELNVNFRDDTPPIDEIFLFFIFAHTKCDTFEVKIINWRELDCVKLENFTWSKREMLENFQTFLVDIQMEMKENANEDWHKNLYFFPHLNFV